MGDYFKPWRRKIGVVTLLMACVFAVGWVRNRSIDDSIYVDLPVFSAKFFSGSDKLEMIARYPLADAETKSCFQWDSNPRLFFANEEVEKPVTPSRYDSFEFFVSLKNLVLSISLPYSIIVVPLALLSAWLLLRKPRPKPSKPQSPSFGIPHP